MNSCPTQCKCMKERRKQKFSDGWSCIKVCKHHGEIFISWDFSFSHFQIISIFYPFLHHSLIQQPSFSTLPLSFMILSQCCQIPASLPCHSRQKPRPLGEFHRLWIFYHNIPAVACFLAGAALQMKGRWKSNINVLFPLMYSQKWNCCFLNRIIMICRPVPTLIYLWEIYIFPGSVSLLLQGNMWTNPGNI